ncbi:hypothetical protein YPPY94_1503, partial [Yersinia pestis PY-94]
MAAVLAS